ncbi:MAG TPA: type II toxin-antitoxin system RelE/ParE family toxin [Polyangiaceae bacterium]|nr:type II toxin-antitoxin system RelE/ParE family toxin [Polyangiaceae bacterium]
MRFEIVLAPEALRAFRNLAARHRVKLRDALETHLRHQPTKVSKSRIKRLRGIRRPQYRLRVDEIRVFYDVTGSEVWILAIIPKAEAEAWLKKEGTPE